MNERHEQEKKQFMKLLGQEDVDELDKRFQVLESFLKSENHETCREIATRLEQDGVSLGPGFIAETMELLCRFGFAHKLKFDDGPPRYEHRHLGTHHDHMVCTKCGTIIEFRDETLERQQVDLAAAYGFHMLQHKMEIYGICGDCLKERSMVVPLSRTKQGEFLVIKGFEGGKKAQMRLTSMGLRVGDIIEVISTQAGGQLVIALDDNRFVIGRGLAMKVRVEHVPHHPQAAFPAPRELEAFQDSGETIALSRMKEGQEGVIARVAGETRLRRRILEMGINRGATVYVEKYAPLKDPIELIVKGYHVSMRVEEAAHIQVEGVRTVTKK
ncbi:MAG: Fur family transcriptional regulator [Desulfobacteraceae bacterium]|nr:Fur family transcriptional regulator [Desulfobacteraceae bacterium]